ncbi:hypothetical protein [Moorena sp. SIO3I6]|nr:hypothetical protein [Moorena sp. SIO3I6]NEP24970.1 hypothetical protein [Moorena sp. SIO3I6]
MQGFREQGTGNREQGIGNRESGIGKKLFVPHSYEKRYIEKFLAES